MDQPSRLFFSYSSLERGFAARLAADLKNAGFAIWMDCLDIRPGSNWDAVISEAIDSCRGMIAVLSPSYVRSEICKNELARAQRAGHTIVPVLLEPVEDNEWPLLIQRRQFVNFGDWANRAGYHARLDELLGEIHRTCSESVGALPDSETRYLNLLLAHLALDRGVLHYVNLAAAAQDAPPENVHVDYESGFDVMVDVKSARAADGMSRLHDLERLLRQRRSLVVLGEAGSGKTTTLRWLARRAALARRADPRNEPLPVFVALGQWRDGEPFNDFLAEACPLLRGLQQPLAGGDILLLLDGLNEMGPSADTKVEGLRAWLAAQRDAPRVGVTCRPAEYARMQLGDWPVATLRPLDETQIRQFASRYLLSRSGAFLEEVLRGPLSSVKGHNVLAELACNPYMLSALIFLYQVRPDEPLPANIGILFSKLVKALWKREERRRQRCGLPPTVDWDTARPAFAAMALALIEGNEADDVPTARVEAALGGELLRLALDASLLVEHGSFVRFHHALLRTYLAAEALAQVDVDTLDKWCRAHVPHWEALAVAWSGISRRADEYLMKINWQDAADLVGLGFVAGAAAIKVPVTRALEELAVDHWRSYEPAMDALKRIGEPAVPMLLEALEGADPDLRAKITFVLSSIASRRAASPTLPLRDAPSDEARDREVLAGLSEQASDPSPAARAAAANAIGALGDPLRVPALRALLADDDSAVRRAAAQSLGALGDSESAAALSALTADADDATRAAAVRALLKMGGTDLQSVVTKALVDVAEAVRLAALEGVPALDPVQAIAMLVRALTDESDMVFQRAADLLSTIAGERGIEPLARALGYPSARVASAAAHALGRIGGPRARDSLLAGLRGDSHELWGPCANALEDDGWLPAAVADIVRVSAARAEWTGCLALGADAIEGLRAVLRLATDDLQRGAAATLHTMGWRPTEPDAEWFRFAAVRADWLGEDRQHPGERPSLLGWLNSHPSSRGPVRSLLEELIPKLHTPLGDGALSEALRAGDLRQRYLATVAAGVAGCRNVAPLILENLNADPSLNVLEYGPIRVASAQALGNMGVGQIPALLDHATRDIPSGLPVYRNASAVVAIQAVARSLRISDQFFVRIPALALGRKQSDDNERFEVDLWLQFPWGDPSALKRVLEGSSVSMVVEALGKVDRNKMPGPGILYTDMAYWELQSRLALLSLLVIAPTLPDGPIRSLAISAMARFWGWTAEPVLREVHHWAGPAARHFALAELQRLRQTEDAKEGRQPTSDESSEHP